MLQGCCDKFPQHRTYKRHIDTTSVVPKQTYVVFWQFSRLTAGGDDTAAALPADFLAPFEEWGSHDAWFAIYHSKTKRIDTFLKK